MADPLSAAGTAVGIVSLGIQVSQGLIAYYSQFKAHDEDVAHLVRKSESLRMLLEALSGLLAKVETRGSEISPLVRNTIGFCLSGLEKLQAAGQKYGNLEIPVTREDKIRALGKRVLYPFRKSTLYELSITLDDLLRNMQLALQVLNVETSQYHSDMVNEATANSTQHISTNFDNMFSRMDQLVLNLQAAQSQSHLHTTPALLASMCQDMQSFESQQEFREIRSSRAQYGRQREHMLCSCPRKPQAARGQSEFYGWSSSWSQSTRHLPRCPLSRYAQQRIDILGAKYTYCTHILGYSIEATFSVSRGAGGLAISPQLTLRAVVPFDSPAFELFMPKDIFSLELLDVDDVLQQLNTLFRDRKASPLDTNPEGVTLLHAAVGCLSRLDYFDFQNANRQLQDIVHLLDSIISLGADPLARNNYNSSVLDVSLSIMCRYLDFETLTPNSKAAFHSLLAKLFDYGLSIERTYDLFWEGSEDFYMAQAEIRLVHNGMKQLTDEQRLGIDMPDIIKAIYCKDGNALKNTVQGAPESLNGIFEDWPCLHLSIEWPQGLSILLDAGVPVSLRDKHGTTALYHACRWSYFSSLPILLDHDSPVGCFEANDCLQLIDLYWKAVPELQTVFISHLLNRRKRLLALAFELLPNYELERLAINKIQILDAEAAAVTSAILESGHTIEPALIPSRSRKGTTVFHTQGLSLPMAILLYEAGFREVDKADWQGVTPFWIHCLLDDMMTDIYGHLEVLQWLWENGADVYHKYPKFGGTALHALGANLAWRLKKGPKGNYTTVEQILKPLPAKRSNMASLVLVDDVVDDCECACSKDGCRVITSAMKTSRMWYLCWQTFTGQQRKVDIRIETCLWILGLVEKPPTSCPWIASEAIRTITFEWLELTHTCHVDPRYSWSSGVRDPLSAEEIREIQQEECLLLEQHEALVTAFESQYTELGLSLTVFIKDYWHPRILEVLEENRKQKWSKEEEQTMRELGVVVYEEDGRKEGGSDSEEEDESEDVDEGQDEEEDEEDFHDCVEVDGVA